MSMTLVKPYFVARCEALGFKRHVDVFNLENIPSTIIDGSFHVSFTQANLRQFNQNDLELELPCEVVFYVKGYRTPDEGHTKAVAKAEALIKECEKPNLRLGTCLKNVIFQALTIEPIGVSNDNLIRVRLDFQAITSIAV